MYQRIHKYLFRLEAERAHNLGTSLARLGQRWARKYLTRQFAFESERLRTEVLGLEFTNPFGIAAGFDKNAHLLPFWSALGCGFAEVGSVTARKSKGNPKPRAFRLPQDKALINRMGLNNDGARKVARRLSQAYPTPIPVAVSLAKTHDPRIQGQEAVEDFCKSFSLCAPYASMVVLNLSCPNTAEGRTFEDPNALDDLLKYLMPIRASLGKPCPVLLKLSPPVTDRFILDSEVDEIVAVGRVHDVDGFVACNTDPGRELIVHTDEEELDAIGRGGVSGMPLAGRSIELIRYLYKKTDGQTPVVGVGGVFTGLDAYAKIRAGASLVQLYTSLVYQGPAVFRRLKKDVDQLLERDGFESVGDAVGADA